MFKTERLQALHFCIQRSAEGIALCNASAEVDVEAMAFLFGGRAAVLLHDYSDDALPDHAHAYSRLIEQPLGLWGITAENICWIFCDAALHWRRFALVGDATELIELSRPTAHGATDYACNFLQLYLEKPLDMLLFALARQPSQLRYAVAF